MLNIFDKKEYKEIIVKLEKLGLSEKDSKVYLYLLERTSEIGSSKIVNATNLHSQYVYNSLESLENKGLIKHVIQNNRKKWSANPPKRIESLIEEKRIVANEVLDKLESMFTRQHAQEFEVFQGEDQFIAHQFQLLEEAAPGDFLEIIGLGDTFHKIMGPEMRKAYNIKNIEKKRIIRFIGAESQREYLEGVRIRLPNFTYKILTDFKEGSLATSIRPKSISFQMYGNPLLCFTIRSTELAKDYRQFFDSLWNLAKK